MIKFKRLRITMGFPQSFYLIYIIYTYTEKLLDIQIQFTSSVYERPINIVT